MVTASEGIPVRFTDLNGDLIDLTGWTLIFTMKHHRLQDDADAALQKRLTVTGSEALVLVQPEDTNELPPYTYEYDIQLSTPDGSGVRTFLMGRVRIESGVTHSLS